MSNKFDFAINGISSTSDGTTKVNGQLVATQDWVIDNINEKITGYTYDNGEVSIEGPSGVNIEATDSYVNIEAGHVNIEADGVVLKGTEIAIEAFDGDLWIDSKQSIRLTYNPEYEDPFGKAGVYINNQAVATQEWTNNQVSPINETISSLNETIIALNSTVEGLKNQITDGSFDLDYTYVDNNSAYTLNGRGKCVEDDIVVGSHQFKVPVKYVEALAFNGDSTITSLKFLGTDIVIKDSTNYTEGAFRNCVNLSSVDFTGVSEIGWYSFRNNPRLNNINLKGVKRIGGHAFHDSGNACQIETADGVERIEESAFMNAQITGDLILPSTLDYIGARAFSGINATTVIFNSTPSALYSNAFENSSIRDIYVPWSKGEVAGAPWGAQNATIHYAEPEVSVDTETGELTISNGEFNSTNSELTLVNATYNADTGELII